MHTERRDSVARAVPKIRGDEPHGRASSGPSLNCRSIPRRAHRPARHEQPSACSRSRGRDVASPQPTSCQHVVRSNARMHYSAALVPRFEGQDLSLSSKGASMAPRLTLLTAILFLLAASPANATQTVEITSGGVGDPHSMLTTSPVSSRGKALLSAAASPRFLSSPFLTRYPPGTTSPS